MLPTHGISESRTAYHRLVVLASGSGTNFQAVMDACATGELPAHVAALISDRKNAFALERARRAGIPAHYLPFQKPLVESPNGIVLARQHYDERLAGLAASYQPSLVVLAGWMRLLSMSFLNQFPMRVINLHPALPGMFAGTNAIERAYQAYQAGHVAHTGVMVHFVPDEGMDNGPIIAQEIVPIYPGDALADLETRVHHLEHSLLVRAIKSVLTGPAFAQTHEFK